MICVTGAGGTVGSEVIKQLESAKAPFRAAYFSNEKAEAASCDRDRRRHHQLQLPRDPSCGVSGNR